MDSFDGEKGKKKKKKSLGTEGEGEKKEAWAIFLKKAKEGPSPATKSSWGERSGCRQARGGERKKKSTGIQSHDQINWGGGEKKKTRTLKWRISAPGPSPKRRPSTDKVGPTSCGASLGKREKKEAFNYCREEKGAN